MADGIDAGGFTQANSRRLESPCATRRVKVDGDWFHPRVPEGAIYVGREMPYLRRSPYANPYSVKEHGREGALRLFREYLDQHPDLVDRARAELTGRALACWCKPGEACHVDVLIEYINEPDDEAP
jgi:Domain of unknown function (DUF4326)